MPTFGDAHNEVVRGLLRTMSRWAEIAKGSAPLAWTEVAEDRAAGTTTVLVHGRPVFRVTETPEGPVARPVYR